MMSCVGTADSLGIQWFFEKNGAWLPFDEDANCALEAAHAAGDAQVPFGEGNFPADLVNRKQENLESYQSRRILRGSWFYQRSSGELQPFPEHIAHGLELAFPAGAAVPDDTAQMVDTDRVVVQAIGGGFAQVNVPPIPLTEPRAHIYVWLRFLKLRGCALC